MESILDLNEFPKVKIVFQNWEFLLYPFVGIFQD